MSDALWRSLAEKALGGRSLEALSSLTVEGLRIEPLYPRALGDSLPAPHQRDGAWRLSQRSDHPDPEEANRLALLDLEGGADALCLVFRGDTARGFGLRCSADALATALDRVELDLIASRVDAGAQAAEAARLLTEVATERRLTSAGLAVDLGFDPIGCLARNGRTLASDSLGVVLASARSAGLAGCAMLADGRPYHEAGSGEAEELAAVVATGVAYLRLLESAGLKRVEANAAIAFLLVADADFFLSLAKFRALRRLWACVEEACGLEPRPVRLHAETAWRMMTRRDPWVNVMRTTVAAFAAGIGGADVVTVLPFTAALGLPEAGARRLARNTQLVLRDEAHLAMVDDPAAGSGGLEALTEQLCTTAWSLFQQIEREGGIEASLRSGAFGARIAKTAARRRRAVATLEQGITGTSTFPARDGAAFALADAERLPEAAPGECALPSIRDAEPFEALRVRADAMTASSARPAVFLATLGSAAGFGARTTAIANVLAAAGIEGIVGTAETYRRAMTPVACLCGSDASYVEEGAPAVATLRAARATCVFAAASAGSLPPALQQEGIDVVLPAGGDVVEILAGLLDRLAQDGSAPR